MPHNLTIFPDSNKFCGFHHLWIFSSFIRTSSYLFVDSYVFNKTFQLYVVYPIWICRARPHKHQIHSQSRALLATAYSGRCQSIECHLRDDSKGKPHLQARTNQKRHYASVNSVAMIMKSAFCAVSMSLIQTELHFDRSTGLIREFLVPF